MAKGAQGNKNISVTGGGTITAPKSTEFSNVPVNFNVNGLKELKDFVGTRAQLYSLINKTNPLAIIDKRQALVSIDNSKYLMIMQNVKGGQQLKVLWKLGENGGQYNIQNNTYHKG